MEVQKEIPRKILLITHQLPEANEVERILGLNGFSVVGVSSLKTGAATFDPAHSSLVLLCTPAFDEEEKIFLRKMRNRSGNNFIPFIQMIPSQFSNGGIDPSPLADDILFLPVSGPELKRKLEFHLQFKEQYERYGIPPENPNEEVQQKLVQLKELLNLDEIRREIHQKTDEKDIIQLYLKKIERAVLAEACLLFEWNEDSRDLVLAASQTAEEEWGKRPKIGSEETFTRYWQASPKPLMMNGVDRESAVARVIREAIGMNVEFMIASPLTVNDQFRGIVLAINKLYRKPFSKSDLSVLNLLVSHLSLSIENLKLKNEYIEVDRLVNKKDQAAINHLIVEREFYQSIFNSMTGGLLSVDLDGNITFINRQGLELLGYSFEEIIGKKLQILLGEKQTELLLNTAFSDESMVRNLEMIIKGKYENEIHIGYSGTQLKDRENRLVGTIITFRDISLIKAYQSELLRMDRLSSLGVLAAGVAHEIRNPLAGIKTIAQGMESELPENDPKHEYIERIIRQVNRLDDLLKAFFVYAKPSKPNPQQCHIPEIFREVINLVDQRLKEQQISLVTRYERNLPKMFVDFNQMEQIFFNLILNAIEAMPNGGTLGLDVGLAKTAPAVLDRRRRRAHQSIEGYIKIVVSDTGIGIKPEDLESIFNPFYTTKSYGTGLGLSIVYQIIKEHNGEISVKSELNRGTKFEILLPMIHPGKSDEVIDAI